MIAAITQPDRGEIQSLPPDSMGVKARPSLLQVLWRRRWTLVLTAFVCMAIAEAYLWFATPVFTCIATLDIEQSGVKILSDPQGASPRSETFIFTQAQIIQSTPVLARALEKAGYLRMKTFADVASPIAWMRLQKDFRVEVGKKDDIVTISLDSPYPDEAVAVVNSVVDSYMVSQGTRNRSTTAEMLKVLQAEKEKRYAELGDRTQAMLKFKKENGALSFQFDKGNIILGRLAKLSDSLAVAELDTFTARSEMESVKATFGDPAKLRHLAQELQTKGTNAADKSYDDLRGKLTAYKMEVTTLSQVLGANNPQIQILSEDIAEIEKAIAGREKAIVESYLLKLEKQFNVCQANEAQVRDAFESQKREALELNNSQAEYDRIQEEIQRTQKQCGDLDSRIKELKVNSEDIAPMDIQVVEAATVPDFPTKPKPSLILGIGLLIGILLGSGLALVRDAFDQRIRNPDEASILLGLPLLGMVPRMRRRQTVIDRGQLVHRAAMSGVAEAYRTIRTNLSYGALNGHAQKTILVTSPSAGDGRSTTASNLAIAMAQAGYRTLLLEADLRHPVQHQAFQIDPGIGLCAVMAGEQKLRDAVRPTGIPGLDILPCGPIPPNPSEIIASKRFAQLMAATIAAYERVIIDAPPLMAVADARILAASAHQTLLVLRLNRSTRATAAQAVVALQNVGARLFGMIVNAVPRQKAASGDLRYFRTHQQPVAKRGRTGVHAVEVTVTAAGRAAPQHARALESPRVQELLAKANSLNREVHEPAESETAGDEPMR